MTGAIPAGNGHSGQWSAPSGGRDATGAGHGERGGDPSWRCARAASARHPGVVTQVGLRPVGYTTATDFRRGPRTLVEEVGYLDGWGAPLVGAPGTP